MRIPHPGTFAGGLALPEDKSATRHSPVRPLGPLAQLRVPLELCGPDRAEPTVAPGDRVEAGQVIARAGELPVRSPATGIVRALGRGLLVGGAGGLVETPTVDLAEPMGPEGPVVVAKPCVWQDLEPEALLERIAAGGLVRFGRPVEPLHVWLARARRRRVDTLILNGMENQPALTASHRLLVEHGPAVLEGLGILGQLLGTRRRLLAVDRRHIDDYRHLDAAARAHRVQPLAVLDKYPAGHDILLTRLLTRREVPPGHEPLDVGAACVSPEACLALHRWLTAGESTLGRVVTLGGPSVHWPGNYLVPFGAQAGDVLASVGAREGERLCHGSPMAGLVVGPAVLVGPMTSALLALAEPAVEPPTACIRCAWCTDHCPVRLDVANLNDLFEMGQLDRAGRYGVQACLGCGVCSFVCPARLPLTHRMAQMRRALNAPTVPAAALPADARALDEVTR